MEKAFQEVEAYCVHNLEAKERTRQFREVQVISSVTCVVREIEVSEFISWAMEKQERVLGNRWAWRERFLGSGSEYLAALGISARDVKGLIDGSVHGTGFFRNATPVWLAPPLSPMHQGLKRGLSGKTVSSLHHPSCESLWTSSFSLFFVLCFHFSPSSVL